MRVKTIPGGWYADALPSGAYAVIFHADAMIETHLGMITSGERILFPRITEVGGFKVAGPTHADPPRVLEYAVGRPEGWATRPEKPCGASPVIYDAAGVLHVSSCGPVGSQGYRYATANGLVTGDATYSPKHGVDLHEWTDLGNGYRVGQGPDDNGAWFYDGAKYYEVVTGKARFIRAHRDGDHVSIACWVEPKQSVIVWATVAELMALPAKDSPRLPKPTPTPTPEPTPEPEPTMPDSLLPDLQAERAKYPERLQDPEDAADILNAVAWKHRGDGWGLSAKPSGNNVFSEAHGKLIAYDILHHKPTNTLWDVATGEWEVMQVQWAHQPIHHNDPNRPWLAPVEPVGEPVPVPVPTPEPTPTPAPVPPVDLTPMLEKLADIEGDITALYEVLTTVVEAITAVHTRLDSQSYTGHARIWGQNVTFTLTPKEPQ
jgi:hypothetical protein